MTDQDPASGGEQPDPEGTTAGATGDELLDISPEDAELVDRLFGVGAVQPGDLDVDLGDLAGGAPAGEPGDGVGAPVEFASCEEALEDALGDLERVTAERDEYLAVAQRLQADFENYKRRIDAQRVEQAARAAESLVEELLPVLDGCEAALAHGAEDVAPIWSSLFGTLERKGLAKVDEIDVVFDPNRHEAVLREDGEGIDGEPAVAEIMRAGYQWNGRVLRPAMVKVRG